METSSAPPLAATAPGRVAVVLPTLAGRPLAAAAVRQGLRLALALRARGRPVVLVVADEPDTRDERLVALAREVADSCGAAVAELGDDGVPLDGMPAARLSHRLDGWLKRAWFATVVVPDYPGLAYYSLLDKRYGRAHGQTRFVVHAVGPSRALMRERALYPTLDRLAELFIEEAAVPLADALLAPTGAETAAWRVRLGTALAAAPLDGLLREGAGSLAAALPPVERKAGAAGPVLCLTQRAAVDEVDLFARALARAVPSLLPPGRGLLDVAVLQLGEPPGEAQRQAVLRWLADRPVRVAFHGFELWRDGETAAALLGACRFAAVPAFSGEALPLLQLCHELGVPALAQDHPRLLAEIPAAAHPTHLFSNDYKVLADRLVGAGAGLEPVAPVPDASSSAAALALLDPADRVPAAYPTVVVPPADGPLVSVCVTLYDRWHLMPQALASIADQTYRTIEIVVSDDGSDDPGAVAYLERLERGEEGGGRYPPLRVARQLHHSLGACRNNAVRHARGEFVLFMDDDNLAKRHEVATFVQAALASGADALSCFCDLFADERAVAAGGRALARRLFLGPCATVGVATNCLGDANSFFRRDAFDRFGPMVEAPQLGFEDWEILARILLAGGRVGVVPEALFWYRESPTAMTSRTRQLANNLLSLQPFLERDPAFGDLLWMAKGAYIEAVWGIGRERP